MNKLAINVVAGILDILGSIMYFLAPFILGISFLGEVAGELEEGSTGGAAIFFMIFAIVGLVIHIIALVMSKKANISITGNVLGIIAHGLYVLAGIILALPAFIICIISAVFTLKQKNLPVETTPIE